MSTPKKKSARSAQLLHTFSLGFLFVKCQRSIQHTILKRAIPDIAHVSRALLLQLFRSLSEMFDKEIRRSIILEHPQHKDLWNGIQRVPKAWTDHTRNQFGGNLIAQIRTLFDPHPFHTMLPCELGWRRELQEIFNVTSAWADVHQQCMFTRRR